MVTSRSKTAAEAAANKRTTRSASGTITQNSPVPAAADRVPRQLTKVGEPSTKKTAPKKAASKPASTAKAAGGGRKKKNEVYCLCKGTDDGTPMIKCEGECQNWYHFRCIDLADDVAEEIEQYYCPDCEAKTGLKTVSKLDFEGPDAMEIKHTPDEGANSPAKMPVEVELKEDIESVNETEDDGSADDYAEPVSNKTRSGKRVTRRLSFSDKSGSDSEGDSDSGQRKRTSRGGARLKRIKKASTSPAPESSTVLKRRGSSAQQPAAKRSKTSEGDSGHDDPLRKYCLSKLDEAIKPMFIEYKIGENNSQTEKRSQGVEKPEGDENSQSNGDNVELSTKELTEDEKLEIDQKVASFVAELERCMMDTYAESDKSGRPSASGKYKERFRMLSFNLAKADRVALRKGIASGRITPAQLNVMSSTDLANEQTKHEIELAEKEALEHSILQKITAPRAKMTHKGFEAIEDVSGQRNADAMKEEEDQRMEMEKREREKLAKLRSIAHTVDSPASPVEPTPLSAGPPMSPTQPRSSSWGAPPPLPLHTLQHSDGHVHHDSPLTSRPPARPLFIPSANDYPPSMEEGLNLADLINIDDDVPTHEVPQPPQSPQQRASTQQLTESGSTSTPTPEITTPSGPSPFAPAKPLESPRRTSFDLNSLWTGNERHESPIEQKSDQEILAVANVDENQEEFMEIESADASDDNDLDALLEQSGNDGQLSAVPERPTSKPNIEDLPQVWTGRVLMPVEATNALAQEVVARQIGGRSLNAMSGFWQTLFPTTQARIDGRVPVDKSTQYLVTTRLNVAKELIAVCFTPLGEDKGSYDELINYLIGKDRHALVFPWGVHPKTQAPGRELYIIPLLREQPIPEYIELLDNLHLPKERESNVLLGVFVLNKGKLVASTPPPALAQPAPVQPPVPSTSTAPPPLPASFPTIPNVAILQNILPNISAPGSVPLFTPPVPIPPVKVDPTALAAEVASLTPEQISFMLQHLSQSQALPVPPVNTILPITGPPAPFSMPPFPPQFPPNYQQPSTSLPPLQHHSPPHPHGGYGEHEYDDYEDYSRRSYGKDERGAFRGRGRGRGQERGRRGGRGRGRPFNEEVLRHRDSDHRPVDSGWGGRGRGDMSPGSPPHARKSRFGN